MTVLELIRKLIDQPMDAQVYVGKGMGPAETLEPVFAGRYYVMIKP